jgi:2-iminobutanoate/2-iminopropanoate deaminase
MKNIVQTESAPKPIGPYSVATQFHHLVFTAGQLGIVPTTGDLIEGGVREETRQALMNVSKILEAAGSGLEWVMKTTVFLREMSDFALMNEVYAEFFTKDYPARTTIQAAALPKNAAVEIEAIAIRPGD